MTVTWNPLSRIAQGSRLTLHVIAAAGLVIVFAGTLTANEVAPARFISELARGHKQRVVLYGTSITAHDFWGKDLRRALEKRFPGLSEVINAAHSGWNSADGLRDLETRVLDKHPDALILEFGVNDAVLRFHISTNTARKNLEAMIDRVLASNPHCEIILQTMNAATGVPGTTRPNLNDYYEVYRLVARDRKLTLVDHYPNWKRILDRNVASYAAFVPDGIHPTRAAAAAVVSPVLWASLTGEKTDAIDRLLARIPAYKYVADVPSAASHRDSTPPGMLIDGRWDDPGTGSVQYDADVTITVDLAARTLVKGATLIAYHLKDEPPIAAVEFSTSPDGVTWTSAATVAASAATVAGGTLSYGADLAANARYVRMLCRKREGAARMLLAEITVAR